MSQATPQPRSASNRRLIAIGLMCAGVTVFALLDTTTKVLTVLYALPISQVVFMRYLVHALLLIGLYGPARVPSLMRANKPGLQAARSFFMLSASVFNIWALQYLRLDQTITIFFVVPLFTAALAGPLLNEWVGWRRMIAILLGFAGVVIVLQPGTDAMHWAFILSFLAMASYASLNLITRYVRDKDDQHTTNFWSPLVGTVLSAPVALAQWTWSPEPIAWGLLLVMGALGGYGHWLLIRAHADAPAPILSPFIYVGFITMVALGWLIFDELPDGNTLLGAAIIVASGLYLLARERKADG